MMSQQALFADTIIAMKKAMKRKACMSDSDDDDDLDYRGNRGQKLKRRAKFAREGQLAPPSGPGVTREYVNHAGYSRAIICRNPPLLDDEGYDIDSDDDDYEERLQEITESAATFNPYASMRLESILAPLTSVTDLPSHPTLSRSYTSKTLTDLTKQARSIMHKENSALWKVKHLHTKLVGDQVWVPCNLMETADDLELYQEPLLTNGARHQAFKSDAGVSLENSRPEPRANGPGLADGVSARGDQATQDADISMTNTEGAVRGDGHSERMKTNGDSSGNMSKETDTTKSQSADSKHSGSVPGEREEARKPKKPPTDVRNEAYVNGVTKPDESNGEPNNELVNLPASAPMSTTSFDGIDDMFIHPIFLPPRSALPNRDLGIPEAEAEDLRRLLQLWVQKQEEVCRGARRLNEGLLRADRLRQTVLQWSKYEAHCGPNRDMSDGEDWYDKEEWGFEEDLKKGQDEEEEDTMQTTKKTRARR